jgi:hypothetical protein
MNELELKKIEAEVPTILECIKKKTILSDGDIVPIIEIIQEVKRREQEIIDFLDPIRESAYETYKLAKKRKNDSLAPLIKIRELADQKIKEFKLKEIEKARIEAEKLELKQIQKEAKKREKLELKAEEERKKGNIEKADLLEQQAEDVEFATPMIQVRQPERKFKDETGKSTFSVLDDFDVEIVDFDIFLNAIIDRKMSIIAVKIVNSEVKKHLISKGFGEKGFYKECLNLGIRKIDKIKTIVRG